MEPRVVTWHPQGYRGAARGATRAGSRRGADKCSEQARIQGRIQSRIGSSMRDQQTSAPSATAGRRCRFAGAASCPETAMDIVLYYAPNACSLVPYITLTEANAKF